MRVPAAAIVVGVVVVAAPAAASAENGFEAQWVGQTPPNGTLIESGELLDATATFRNVGTKTWQRPGARLGTTGTTAAGRDRASAFQADSWLALNRAAGIEQPAVAPNELASFRFQFRGPPVTEPTNSREHFAPVQDGPDRGWTDGSATLAFGGVYWDLTVRPSVPPTLTVDAAPDVVTAGDPVPVTATAADNVRVRAVAARIDGQPSVALAGNPASGGVPTAGLAPGAYTLTVAAVDGAGNVTPVSRPLTIAPATGGPNGSPAGAARLRAGLTSRRLARAVVRSGRRPVVVGRLLAPDNRTPITGAAVRVEVRRDRTAEWVPAATPVTGARGRFSARVPAGPSARVRVSYRALTLQAEPTVQRVLRLQTRAPVTLAVSLRRRVLRMRGRVPAAPFPRGGVLVSLQGKQAGDRWRPFKTVRARGAKRRFAGVYRFEGGGRFRVRAVVNEQPGYPYTRGTSRGRSVRVR